LTSPPIAFTLSLLGLDRLESSYNQVGFLSIIQLPPKLKEIQMKTTQRGKLLRILVTIALLYGAVGGAPMPGVAYGATAATPRAWGYNSKGQLGDGTTTSRSTPVQVSGLTGVVAVATGDEHSLALKSDNTVWAWGSNYYGQLGDSTHTDRYTPVQVKSQSGVGSLTSVVAIAAGLQQGLALKSDGTVWAWGYGRNGQLGTGTNQDADHPVQVSGLSSVVAIAAGNIHSLALMSDGTVWAWGYNGEGQLGDGTTLERWAPVHVKGTGGVGYLSSVVAIAAGGSHSLALKSDGTLWAWGDNSKGQLGDGTTTESHTPVQVSGLSSVLAIAGGGGHSLAIKSDGTAQAWGLNNHSQLGDGTTTDRATPVQVSGLSSVVAIAAGGWHSLAIKSDGTVRAWGYNNYGQLGDGTTTSRTTPVQVSTFTGANAIAGGGKHSLALANSPPTAVNDSYSTNEDTPLNVAAPGVLDNDTDIDGGSLTAIKVTNPAHGTVTMNSNGSFTYNPAADWNGMDSFNYKANDGSADSKVATVTITVKPVNDPPVTKNDSYSTNEDTPLTVAAPGVLDNDTDIEGNPLTVGTPRPVSAPTHGVVKLYADGSFVFSPDHNYSGSDSFTYKANDGTADSKVATVTITITGPPSPPLTVASPNGGEKWAAGTTQTIRWSFAKATGYVKIELLKGGVHNRTITSKVSIGTGGSGSYSWAIPSTQVSGGDYKVRITSTSSAGVTDSSDNNFAITSPPLPTLDSIHF
jgi:VCBS repeat-containing protein